MDQNIILTAAAARFASCDTLVGITLFGYDYLLMLPKEIEHIWHSRWTPGKVLFIIVRYMPFIDMPVWPFADAFMGANLPLDCNTATYYTIVTFIIAACLADFTYGLRTWALWNRNKFFGAFLVLSGIGFNLSCILLLAVLQSGEASIRIPGLQGCFSPPSTNDDMWKAYLLTTSFQLVLFLATIGKGIQHLTRHPERLTAVLYRDAFLSFFAQLAIGYINVILLRATGEPNYSLNLTYRALTSNLPSRIIINIREAATGLDRWDCTTGDVVSGVSGVERGSVALEDLDIGRARVGRGVGIREILQA
ncbi:hypothetical protein DACRYDRAFT_25474 [Dacryopinax primogenitus]|uniref:DUF6533 domain-containing protein n=1 Tax=Dacryopinax primogenitus (strain DJM 731) TaxID=1858805 RepID=M5FZ59_DACPD|nr:uncharacterized protein DACRYDRAFT_25474 [Dacryopinax primogenitus]EJT96777.1 hypothetical protein DACRYDRAFT_25474 [Dacryopinax primogenitus]